MSGPLEGVLVVSLEQAVAAPFATRQLADLGARVIKIERASGDFARDYDTSVRGMSSYFVWLNRGKESVVLDLKGSEGQQALGQLIENADVFVQNLAPGAIERLGWGPDQATAVNERLIYASISGYGTGGPMSAKRAYDLLVQCEAGLISITGTPQDPVKVGISIADIAAGMYTYSGILSSLLRRTKTNTGDVLEVSMLDALGEWMGQPYFYARYGGNQQARSGMSHATIAPYGPYPTRDGRVFLGVQNAREWTRFCELVLKRPEIASQPEFAENEDRVKNRTVLDALIASTLDGRSTTDVLHDLDAAEIANARLRDLHEFASHPQLKERDRWRDVESPVGPLRSLLPPVSARGYTPEMRPIPELGQHTDSVLDELASKLQPEAEVSDDSSRQFPRTAARPAPLSTPNVR